MTRQGVVQTRPVPDRVTAVLAGLAAIAAAVLLEHVDDAGVCPVCASSWPCEQALLAEHNLAAL